MGVNKKIKLRGSENEDEGKVCVRVCACRDV